MYNGPRPKDINKKYKDHTYELITCLITGNQKKKIDKKYLDKLGYTRELYKEKFDDAPLIAQKSLDAYKTSANTKKAKQARSKNMTNLNLENNSFRKNRIKGMQRFWKSSKSDKLRKQLSEKAKEQHENGHARHVKKYFQTTYKGSDDQKSRSKRMKENNPSCNLDIRKRMIESRIKNTQNGSNWKETKFKKKYFKNTMLIHQSTYEYEFLELCEEIEILDRIKNGPCLTSKMYPYNYYEPDYLIDGKYCVEIKSWYIEKLQENKTPNITTFKKQLVEYHGYKFIYILDKNYDEFLTLFK